MSKIVRHRRRRRNRMATLMAVVLVILAIAALVSLLFVNRAVRKSFTVEAGSESVAASAFLKKETKNPVYFVSDISEINLARPGEYPLLIGYEGRQYESVLVVKDSVAPFGIAQNKTFPQGAKPEAAAFLERIEDVTDVTVTYREMPDFKKPGKQTVTLVLTDTSGNATELTAELTVVEDTVAPEIYGVRELTAYVGEALSYKRGVYVTDDKDPAPVLSVNSADVNLSAAGNYTAVYEATDASGNKTTLSVPVKVMLKTASYVEESTIEEMAQKTVASVVKEGMTKREQVEAIYQWARSSFTYVNHSDKSDWKQGAYTMMQKRGGDCFSYYAVCKLLFEELDIDNIDVRKVKNNAGDSDHYWSLVSVDDGNTWYHFDATPRVGSGDDFCLVTDAFIDAYSNSHKGSHNRDASLYPATPEA